MNYESKQRELKMYKNLRNFLFFSGLYILFIGYLTFQERWPDDLVYCLYLSLIWKSIYGTIHENIVELNDDLKKISKKPTKETLK